MVTGERRLTATWKVNLQHRLWVTRPLENVVPDPEFAAVFDGSEVKVTLHLEEWPSKISEKRGITIRPVTRLSVSVSRSESIELMNIVPVPPVESEEHVAWGKTHLVREEKYRTAALEILNRLIVYFKYVLRTPLIEKLTLFSLPVPEWRDENGDVVETGMQQLKATWDPPAYLEHTLQPQADASLQYFLENPAEPTLVAEILLDAMGAWKQGNLRRAVIEAAVCAEAATRESFTFPYVAVETEPLASIPELVGRMARAVSGVGFDTLCPNSFKGLGLLFRTRNKGAHEGKPYYIEDDGTRGTVTRNQCAQWIRSVEILLGWLGHPLFEPISDSTPSSEH
jgi:hypothetical protein